MYLVMYMLQLVIRAVVIKKGLQLLEYGRPISCIWKAKIHFNFRTILNKNGHCGKKGL